MPAIVGALPPFMIFISDVSDFLRRGTQADIPTPSPSACCICSSFDRAGRRVGGGGFAVLVQNPRLVGSVARQAFGVTSCVCLSPTPCTLSNSNAWYLIPGLAGLLGFLDVRAPLCCVVDHRLPGRLTPETLKIPLPSPFSTSLSHAARRRCCCCVPEIGTRYATRRGSEAVSTWTRAKLSE